MVKTLGIIGGMGPLATVQMFENIVLNTDAGCDQEHIPILIYNNSKIIDRTDYILGKTSTSPKEELIKSAKKLEDMGADFLVMSCNTAHYFYEDIVENIDIPFLNMIEETAKYILENTDQKKVGIFATEGTIQTKIYHNMFEKYGMEIVTPSKENQKYITDMIYGIKHGESLDSIDGFKKAKKELEDKGVDIFIAACTEISLAIDLYNLPGEIFDPMEILALKAIDFAGKKQKIR